MSALWFKPVFLTLTLGVTLGSSPNPHFSHPRDITNVYVPLARLHQDVLEGTEGGHKMRVLRTALLDTKTVSIAGKQFKAMVVEDKESRDGAITEITRDYFAQSDDGSVYYLGEAVAQYRNGKVVAHEGAWEVGHRQAKPGILMPELPKVGDKFKSEDVPGVTTENDEVVSVSETVTVPAGKFKNCVKVKEMASDGDVEFKYYAPGIGVVREEGKDVDLKLVSHK